MVATKSLPPLDEKILVRFWNRVDKSKGQGPRGACWFWKGYVDDQEYGRIYYQRTTVLAHRLSYFIATGDDPGDLDVLHKCHQPACVRPSHIRKGTHQQNMDDRDKAGRQITMHGIEHPIAKLNDDKVFEIRSKASRGIFSVSDMARQYEVSRRLIRKVIDREAWTHI